MNFNEITFLSPLFQAISILGVQIPLISFIYYSDLFKTYQRKTKLFEFSLDINEEELKWRK